MAHSKPMMDLQEELKCPICLDLFKEPVCVDCGHCFCQACITQAFIGTYNNFPCPQCRRTCRQKNLRPIRSLENIVQISTRLLSPETDLQESANALKKDVEVMVKKTAETEEKDRKPEERVKSLKEEAEDIVKKMAEEEEEAHKLEDEISQKSIMMASESEALVQLLSIRQKVLTSRLENMCKTVLQRKNENMARLKKKLLSVQKAIHDLERNVGTSTSQVSHEQNPSTTRNNTRMPSTAETPLVIDRTSMSDAKSLDSTNSRQQSNIVTEQQEGSSAADMYSSGSALPATVEGRSSDGLLAWCRCGHCIELPTKEERVCCVTNRATKNKIPEGGTCLTEHNSFYQLCLVKEHVRSILFSYPSVREEPEEHLYHRYLRKAAYRVFTAWVYGWLGIKNRKPIPSCCVSSIRSAFPDPTEQYPGFVYPSDGAACNMIDF